MADTATRPASGNAVQTPEQVTVPPNLPDILKAYTKHIIKTQPKDILASSAEYFSRLARQKTSTPNKIDTSNLQSFFSKFYNSDKPNVSRREIDDAARTAGMAAGQITEAVSLGAWTRDAIPWLQLWTLLVAATAGTFISTITAVCDIVGDNGRIMTAPIIEVLQYLSKMDQNVDEDQVTAVIDSLGTSRIYAISDLLETIQAKVQPNDQPYNPKTPLARQPSKTAEEQAPPTEAAPAAEAEPFTETDRAPDQAPEEEEAQQQPQQPQSRQQSRQQSRVQSQTDVRKSQPDVRKSQPDVRKSQNAISAPQPEAEEEQPPQPTEPETEPKREESTTNIPARPELTNNIDAEPAETAHAEPAESANAESAPEAPQPAQSENAPPAPEEQPKVQEEPKEEDNPAAATAQEKDASPQAGAETTEGGQKQ
ncbi:Ropporin-1-like protein [Rhizophlyctis rosea]|uniref:Ropporin-1-like protein n=1 Tax=Rhizophlyctis rosea TaxID=64517 RepID=A0AAD5SE85_9FUNG|nr:Ropporin-1-like protein [Rhizophlyctis rosea]